MKNFPPPTPELEIVEEDVRELLDRVDDPDNLFQASWEDSEWAYDHIDDAAVQDKDAPTYMAFNLLYFARNFPHEFRQPMGLHLYLLRGWELERALDGYEDDDA